MTTRLWPPQGLGETCLGRGDSVAREECQRGYKPELGFSQSLVHSSAPQPWDRKTGQLLVSHRVRFPTPSTWDRPQGPFLIISQLPPGIKPSWFSRLLCNGLQWNPSQEMKRPFFRAGGTRRASSCFSGLPYGPGACFLPARGHPPQQARPAQLCTSRPLASKPGTQKQASLPTAL